MTYKDDSRIMKVDAPKISKDKAQVPDANNLLDNVLERVGLKRGEGSA